MRKYILLGAWLISAIVALGQESEDSRISFKKAFQLKKRIILKGLDKNDTIFLKKEDTVKFQNLTKKEKDKLEMTYIIGDSITYQIDSNVPEGKAIITKKVIVDQRFLDSLSIKKGIKIDTLPASKGYVIFEEDKVWVNPFFKNKNFETQKLYYYQLKNRQTIKLAFSEVQISALTIPIKYRFGNKSQDFSEEFSTAINVNLFVGWTFRGRTKFHHREKVGNIIRTSKWTVGGILGASTVTLDKVNTSSSSNPIMDDAKIVNGLATLGVGVTYNYDKINIGLFSGVDFSVGDNASRWNYNGSPWLGIAIGYSILNLQ